jgi:hypothetical protein
MLLKRALQIVGLSILLTAAPYISSGLAAETGGSDGGGGGVILCLNPDNTVKSVRLVDTVEASFWEDKKPELLEPSEELAKLTWRQQAMAAVERVGYVDPEFKATLLQELRILANDIEYKFRATRGKNLYWPTPQDLSRGRVPPISPGCQIVGAAVYNDDGFRNVTVSHFLWKHLSSTDKAALLFHEAVYAIHRRMAREHKLPVPDSSATRRLTGLAFSKMLDGRPEPATEAKRFSLPGDYQTPVLGGKEFWKGWTLENHILESIEEAVSPFLEYQLLKASRPLYLAEGCQGGHTVEATVTDRALRCQLVLEDYNNARGVDSPSRQTLKPIAKRQDGKNNQVLKFKFQSNTRLDMPVSDMDDVITWENLRLTCAYANGQAPWVSTYATFTLSCKGKALAQAEYRYAAGEKIGPVVLPLRSKDIVTPREYELTPLPEKDEVGEAN